MNTSEKTGKEYMFRKFIAGFFASLIVLGGIAFIRPPQTAHAFLGGSWALAIKEYALDFSTKIIAKRMLQMITRDTVNWINGGFKGSPGFVRDPKRFATEIADYEFNRFLEKTVCSIGPDGKEVCTPIGNLVCSPFRLNIQIALRNTYLLGPQYACTIEDVVGNVQNFYNDFSQGGWPAWFTLSQTTDSLPFGAYIQARDDLYARISINNQTWQNELNWANGLLSWKTCENPDGTPQTKLEEVPDPNSPTGTRMVETELGSSECDNPSINTPGSLVEGQLTKVFGSGVGELEVAEEINEIVGALLNQFTLKLFNSAKGLFGLSGKIETDNFRPIAQVSLDNILEPNDPSASEYCGAFRDGMYPTATLGINSSNPRFTTNRRDITVDEGEPVNFSWCAANANGFGSTITVRDDLGSCPTASGSSQWIANSAFGAETFSFVGAGCVYEITYGAQNNAFEDVLTGDLTVETAESKIIVRVGQTAPPQQGGQCAISTVTSENLSLAVSQLSSEVSGSVSALVEALTGVNYISIASSNGTVSLTPVSPSAASDTLKQQVAAQIGCDGASGLTFMVFQVSDPNQLPPEMLTQLGAERPSQILVVVSQ